MIDKKQVYVDIQWDAKKGKKTVNFADTKGGKWGSLPKEKANATAVLTGSGTVVVDIDTKNFKELDHKLMNLLGKPTIETARGYHYYFDVEKSRDFVTCTNLFKHVDIRSEGGLVFNSYWGDNENIQYKKVGDPKPMPKKLGKYLRKTYNGKRGGDASKKDKAKVNYNNTPKKKMKQIMKHIDCYDDYTDWVTVGMALKDWDEVEGLKLWDKWSQQGESYERNACSDKWSTFATDGSVALGTLYHLAEQNGYVIEKAPYHTKKKGTGTPLGQMDIEEVVLKDDPLQLLKGLGMGKEDYKKISEQKYFIDRFLPIGGLFMLAGDSGAGKSWLAFMAAKRSLQNNNEASCIFIDLDSGASYTKKRIHSIWNTFGKDRFTYISQTKTDSREVIEHLKNIQNSNLNNTIIVIDSLVGITDGNINESNVIKPYLTLFEGLRNSGATVILIHHTKKGLDKDSIPIYAGSFTIKAAMDALYMVSKEKTTIACHLSKARGDYIGRTFDITNFEEMEAQDINYVTPEEEVKSRRGKAMEYENKAITTIVNLSTAPLTKTDLNHKLIKEEKYSTRRASSVIKRAIKDRLIEEVVTNKNKRLIKLVI